MGDKVYCGDCQRYVETMKNRKGETIFVNHRKKDGYTVCWGAGRRI